MPTTTPHTELSTQLVPSLLASALKKNVEQTWSDRLHHKQRRASLSRLLNLTMAPSGPKLDFIGASEVRGGCSLFIGD